MPPAGTGPLAHTTVYPARCGGPAEEHRSSSERGLVVVVVIVVVFKIYIYIYIYNYDLFYGAIFYFFISLLFNRKKYYCTLLCN